MAKHRIDERRLALMKAHALLLNFVRGAVVEEKAVAAALHARRLGWYLFDFPTPAPLAEPHVVALPPLVTSTAETEENCVVTVVDQVRGFRKRGTVHNAANLSNVEMARESPFRVASANANVPDMPGQISGTMSRCGFNIHTMVNKSHGEVACTLVDVDSAVGDDAIRAIAGKDGVPSTRTTPAASWSGHERPSALALSRTDWSSVVVAPSLSASRGCRHAHTRLTTTVNCVGYERSARASS